MQAGKMNERIALCYKVVKENELGEIEENRYVPRDKTRAQVIYKSGARVDDYSIHQEYTVQFVIRFYHNVSETDRVLWRNQYYRIDAIERNREYQLIKLNCTKVDD